MYLVRCSTCDTFEVYESLSDAQEWYNEHAEAEHDVELNRLDDPPGDSGEDWFRH